MGQKILDIGTGSGCISIMLKKYIQQQAITACDVSFEALNIAKKNAAKIGVDINFVQSDLFSNISKALTYFLIVLVGLFFLMFVFLYLLIISISVV